jgi:hypothetical protein
MLSVKSPAMAGWRGVGWGGVLSAAEETSRPLVIMCMPWVHCKPLSGGLEAAGFEGSSGGDTPDVISLYLGSAHRYQADQVTMRVLAYMSSSTVPPPAVWSCRQAW